MKVGRIAINACNFLILCLIGVVCYMIKNDDSDTFGEVLQYVFDSLFAVLFCTLTLVVFMLIKKLRANNRTLVDNVSHSNYFKNEINTL